MSKLFNQAQDRTPAEATNEDRLSELNQLLATVQEGETAAADMAQSRLQNCARIAVPRSSPALICSVESECAAAAEAYRALRTRLMRLQATKGLRSIVISSAVPGEGKTVTSFNLGLCYSQMRDARTVIIDGDLRRCGLTKLMGNPHFPGLAEALAGKAAFHEVVLATDVPNLYVVSAGNLNAPPPELLAGERWKDFIGWCGESFKIVLVDSPPVLPLADFELLSAGCDGVLLTVRAFQTSREVLRNAAAELDSSKVLGIVMNGTENGHAKYSSSYYTFQGKS